MTQSISRTTLAWLLAAAATLLAAPAAFAQGAAGYPSKPLRIVVTFTTGGAPDILARLIGDRLTAEWGLARRACRARWQMDTPLYR